MSVHSQCTVSAQQCTSAQTVYLLEFTTMMY